MNTYTNNVDGGDDGGGDSDDGDGDDDYSNKVF